MNLTQNEWKLKQSESLDSIVLDVRTPEEYQSGHIPNAILLNIGDPQEFMSGINDLSISKSYFIYCRSGARSAKACQILNQQGFTNCYNLLGGILDWQDEII